MNLAAGGDSEPRTRLRSTLPALTGLCAIVGVYFVVKGMPTQIAAAEIEDGTRPPIYNWKRSGTQKRNRYRVAGQLAAADPVAFDNHGASWLCAPLVSGRTDGDRPPRVFYTAPAATFRRAHADSRFAGELHSASAAFLKKASDEAVACGVPDDSYVLIDDGSLRMYLMLGHGALIIGGVVGGLAIVAYVIAARRKLPAPHPNPPNPLPAPPGEETGATGNGR